MSGDKDLHADFVFFFCFDFTRQINARLYKQIQIWRFVFTDISISIKVERMMLHDYTRPAKSE